MTTLHRAPRTFARITQLIIATGIIAVGLTACQQAPAAPESPDTEKSDTASATADPQRIASLSYESTELLAALGLEDRLVLMSESVMNEALGSHQDVLEGAAQTYAVEKELTAEAVIDVNPDLVLMSPRHGADETIGQVLEAAGIETLVMPNSWATPAELVENVQLIGDAVGASAEAEKLAAELTEGLTQRAEATGEAPEVLILSNQAGRPFVTAGKAFPLELVRLAGGVNASDTLGLTVSGPIQVEQVLAADPDGIILVDMNGSGDRLFAELLSNEAITALDAVANDRVLRVQGKSVQALGLTNTIAGLDELTEWVTTLP